MNRFVYIVPIVAVACLYRLVVDYRRKGAIVRLLGTRPQLTAEAFATRHFPPEQAEIAREVRECLSSYLPFSLSGLLPTDRLFADLHMDWFGKTAWTACLMDLEERFRVQLRHQEGVSLRTVGDLVAAIARARHIQGCPLPH